MGETRQLVAKGVSFGSITHRLDGTWDMSKVEGVTRVSIAQVFRWEPSVPYKAALGAS